MSSIQGLDSLLKKLDELGNKSTDVLEKSMKKNIMLVEAEAKTLCPVNKEPGGGRLRGSIDSRVEREAGSVKGIVFTNVEYAPYVEFGTGQRGEESPSPPKSPEDVAYRSDWAGMEAQPYLYPALVNNKKQVIENIKSDLKKAISEVANK